MRGGRNPRASEAPTSALGRPWFVIALLVLVANDHWLKAAFPGPVTGKISDFAGPAVVAAALSALIGRTPAVVLTTVGFASLKVVPGVAEAAEVVLGGVTRRDPTDLMGLAVMPFVWRALAPSEAGARARHRRTQAAAGGSASRADTAHGWIRARVVPLGGAAVTVMALTATSAPQTVEVRSLAVSEGAVFAELADADDEGEASEWAVSTDGGLTWQEPEEEVPAGLPEAGDEACRGDGSCYAARGGSIEERSAGGEWTTAFRLNDNQRELLDYRRSDGGADPDEMFDSVVVAEVAEGESVVVGARDQGVVVLAPSGGWQRISVLDAEATATNGSMVPFEVTTVVLFASLPFALVVAGLLAVARGHSGWSILGSTLGALLIAVATWTVGIGAWAFGTFTAQNPVVMAIVLGAVACAVVLLPLAFVRRAIPVDEAPAGVRTD